MAAFVPDTLEGSTSELLLPVVSSGFAWGLVALLSAMFADKRSTAILFGVGTLWLATITYYSLILFVSRRWYHAADSFEGSRFGQWAGLMSVARSAGVWLAASVCAGALMGVLAHVMRHGTARSSTISMGISFGLLAGRGVFHLFHITVLWVGPYDSFALSKLHSALIEVLLVVASLAIAVWIRRRTVHLPVLALTLVPAIVASAALWYAIEMIRPAL
ncbi:hypothetical protein [Verrucosispora sp. TAA-831]|uniref:hypothetical protein n=1 Tax=Verrucosispora sp. TAA-831 TaxID=3422227 RepID=UPI003D6F8057